MHNQSFRNLYAPLVLLVVLSNVVAVSSIPIMVSRDDARTVIDSAELTLLIAYRNVLAAESAGADITALVESLNEAVDLLNQAKESYDSGDYASALDHSSRSKELSEKVTSEAEQLKAEAERTSQISAAAFFIGVPLLLVALVVAGYYGFKMMRERSVEEIMKKGIKVSEEENE